MTQTPFLDTSHDESIVGLFIVCSFRTCLLKAKQKSQISRNRQKPIHCLYAGNHLQLQKTCHSNHSNSSTTSYSMTRDNHAQITKNHQKSPKITKNHQNCESNRRKNPKKLEQKISKNSEPGFLKLNFQNDGFATGSLSFCAKSQNPASTFSCHSARSRKIQYPHSLVILRGVAESIKSQLKSLHSRHSARSRRIQEIEP